MAGHAQPLAHLRSREAFAAHTRHQDQQGLDAVKPMENVVYFHFTPPVPEMTHSIFLTDEDVARLTGLKTKAKQIAWLRNEGLPFRVNAMGQPIITRVAIEGLSTTHRTSISATKAWMPAVLLKPTAEPVRAVEVRHAEPPPKSQAETLPHYPAGALLRVKDICGDPAHGRPGLLPIVSRTWLKWVEEGKVPKGILLGTRTRVWPVEQVLAVRDGLTTEEQ